MFHIRENISNVFQNEQKYSKHKERPQTKHKTLFNSQPKIGQLQAAGRNLYATYDFV